MMKSCRDVDAIMTPYVDGELTATEASAVDAHLAVCPLCRDHASTEKVVRQVVHAKAVVLGESASPGLRARCIAVTPPKPSERDAVGTAREGWRRLVGWAPLSMAATVVLAVGAVLVLGQNKELEAAFVAQLAIDHDRCFRQLDDLVPDFDSREAARVLASDHGVDVGVPDESADFDLLDVRQCLYGQGGMAHVLCEWRGQALSLFVVPGRSDPELALEIVGHEALVWSQDETSYVLVADQGPVELSLVADYVRQYTD